MALLHPEWQRGNATRFVAISAVKGYFSRILPALLGKMTQEKGFFFADKPNEDEDKEAGLDNLLSGWVAKISLPRLAQR